MKAMLVKELGHPSNMVLEDIPSPTPGKKEVVVTIKACSVNFPDTLMVQGMYQFKPALPFSVGSDIAGCLLYTSPSPRDLSTSRMPSSA